MNNFFFYYFLRKVFFYYFLQMYLKNKLYSSYCDYMTFLDMNLGVR